MLAGSYGLAQAASHTPQPGIQFGGNIELDHTANDIDPADTVYSQTGRIKFEINGRRDFGEYFAAGRGELLVVNDGSTVAEDAWLMLGPTKIWNLLIGHFENGHLFPEGRDTLIEHATGSGNMPVPYEMDTARGRFDGGLRLRIQSVENWLLELGTRVGGAGNNGNTEVFSGVRPVAIYEKDGYVFRVGAEMSDNGLAAGAAGAVDMGGFGVSGTLPVGSAAITLNLTSLDDKANNLESTIVGLNAVIGVCARSG